MHAHRLRRPTAVRAALFGLTLANPAARPRRVTVKVDVHSELLPAYPWSGSEGHPTAADNGQDTVTAAGGALRFADGPTHGLRGREPTRDRRRDRARLPRPAHRARLRGRTRKRRPRRATTARSAAAPAGSCATASQLGDEPVDAVVRGRRHPRRPRQGAEGPGRDPARQVPRPHEARTAAAASTCPATAACRTRSTGASRTSPTSRRRPTDLQIRFVDQGKAYPRPIGTRRPASRSSAPATPTTRGCSPPTASTRRSRRSRSASSSRSRTT